MVETYIALDPTQVKSATDNIGTFSSYDPDIRYALKTDADYKAKVDAKAKEKIAKATSKAEARAEAKIEKANAKAEKKLETERVKLKAEYETDRVFTQSSVTKGLGEIDVIYFDNSLTTLVLLNFAILCTLMHNVKKLKTLENTEKISIFKGFSYGAEGGIRTLVWCYPQTDFESAPL